MGIVRSNMTTRIDINGSKDRYYGMRMNQKEFDKLNSASIILDKPKSEIIRQALNDFYLKNDIS